MRNVYIVTTEAEPRVLSYTVLEGKEAAGYSLSTYGDILIKNERGEVFSAISSQYSETELGAVTRAIESSHHSIQDLEERLVIAKDRHNRLTKLLPHQSNGQLAINTTPHHGDFR